MSQDPAYEKSDRTHIMESLAQDEGIMSRKEALKRISRENRAPITSYAEDEITIEEVELRRDHTGTVVESVTKRVYATCEECESDTVHRKFWWDIGPEMGRDQKCLACGAEEKTSSF